MKTQEFIAVFVPTEKNPEIPAEAIFVFPEGRVPGRLQVDEMLGGTAPGETYIRASLRRSTFLKWKDGFDLLETKSSAKLGRGTVLYPGLIKKSQLRREGTRDLLRALRGSEKDMLEALCRDKGLAGLRQREVEDLAEVEPSRLLRLAQKLEEEGKVKILRFSPLFLISEEIFSFLLEQVVRYLERHLEKHPGRKGIPLERIQKRFALPSLVFRLALRALERSGRARREGQRLVLPSHELRLSPKEERILGRLEEMCYRGELKSVFWEDIKKEFRLSPERLENLLSILIERKKVVQAAEGLYIHAQWLKGVIDGVRALGKKEMTVGDFKAITGLSRKYAIPLLELLDQMGVTRRKGPIREIL